MFGKIVAVAFVTLFSTFGTAHAGGLFGCKGSGALFRGSVGCAVAPVQKKLLTPIVRETVRQGGAALGAQVGGPVGAQLGMMAGDMVNGIAAGDLGGGDAQSEFAPEPQEVSEPELISEPAPAPRPRQLARFGNFCGTSYGVFGPGPRAPIGYPCTVFVPELNMHTVGSIISGN